MRTSSLAALSLLASLVVAAPCALAQPSTASVYVLSSMRESTAARRPVWSGVADPGRVVTLSLDGRLLGTASVDAGGSWAFVAPVDLGAGAHSFGAWVTGSDPLGDTAVRHTFSVVACGASADCEGATPVCDGAACRACRDDRECADDARPLCSRRGATLGMCVAPAPALTTPAAGRAVGETCDVAGRALAGSTVAVLVDGREAGRSVADARGVFSYALTGLARAWHTVAAAQVEAGVVGEAGEGSRVLAVACVDDDACGDGRRCELGRFACVAR
jgi:hypothetical protein